jgi:hypothetical protein
VSRLVIGSMVGIEAPLFARSGDARGLVMFCFYISICTSST